MSIAQLVKELRERTGAGMMDCKKALEATGEDMDKAIDWLRENGIAKAAKKGDRVASEGLTKIYEEGNKAILLELNSETDFVAKNEQFLELLDKLAENILKSDAKTVEEASTITIDGETINDIIINATATIGEKISLRRFEVLTKNDDEQFVTYSHMGGRIGVVVVVKGDNEETSRQVAMHIAASNPQYLDETQIDPELLKHEEEILRKEALNEGKPENIVDNMVKGRMQKFKKEICLLDQPFVIDPDLTVQKALENNGLVITSFARYEVGEGIEKEEVDFAAEVAAQLNN